MAVIEAWGPDIWLVPGDRITFFGVPFPTRMTVVRLSAGLLWVHSPVAATAERIDAVERLGTVGHLVAPSKYHHLFLDGWLERYPSAQCWAGPGLSERRKDVSFAGELGDVAPDAWAGEIDQVHFRGSWFLSEIFFCHRASRSLIVTDILQNHEPNEDAAFWRLLKRAAGVLVPGGAPRDWRLTVTDRHAARRSLATVLGWDFDRVVLCHGRSVPDDGRAFVQRAFDWL